MLKEEKKRVFLIVVLIILIIVYTFELISLGILKKNEGKRLDEDIVDKETYYTISFDEDNGNEIKEEKQKVNEKIKLYTPSKEGYVFSGWLLNGISIDNDYIVTSDIELKATWTDKENGSLVNGAKEYISNHIEEDNTDEYLADSHEEAVRLRYINENINIAILIGSNKISFEINDNLVQEKSISTYVGVKVFKFNDYYVIEYTPKDAQYVLKSAIVINESGKLIGEVDSSDIGKYSCISDINYLKDSNQINASADCCFPVRQDECGKTSLTYKIINNQLEKIEN